MLTAIALRAFGLAKRVPWPVYAALGILLAAWLWGNHRYHAGVHDERARWEAAAAEAKADLAKKARAAAAADVSTKTEGEGAIAGRRKEIDNAKANLPDQGLTDRQRVRACGELRRAGRECPAAPGSR